MDMDSFTHKIGNRVKREVDIFDPHSKLKYGTVTAIYCKDQEWPWSRLKGMNLGRYDELYRVLWDNGIEKAGYLSHGIRSVSS